MAPSGYPDGYLTLNTQRAKQLNVVVQIAGCPQTFSLVPVYEKLRYGDPRLSYGLPGLMYGGLIKKDNVMPVLKIDAGLNITQQIEPEQGRGSVATLSLQFIDKDGYLSKVISPGVIIIEPLASTLVTVSVGYANSDFPASYFKVFRGFISKTTSIAGVVTLELSDANVKRRQTIFQGGTSSLTSAIDASQTSIPINDTKGFIQQILGPDGNYDGTVTTYIKIDDEYMTYGPTGIGPSSITVLSRGGSNSRGTMPAAHDLGATVTNSVQLQGNVIDLALKVMLSGWGGTWLGNVPIDALGTSLDLSNPRANAILFPAGVDVVDEYGLAVGDYIYVAGSTAGNNGTYIITGISNDLGDTNRMVLVNANFTLENPASSVSLSFRSQYDTLPTSCGLSNTPQEIDVATFKESRKFFFSSGNYDQQVAVLDTQAGQNGKDLIEGTLFLPMGIYSITRFGRISMSVTKPPIAGQSLIYLDQNNILEPDKIMVERAINTRRFYNVVTVNYDLQDSGSYSNQANFIDSDSLTKIKVPSVLPINADGVKSSLGGNVAVQERGNFILKRYKKAAYQITIKVNWEAGSQIEVGDIVALVDEGTLKITNLETGERNLGTQLYEVLQRQLTVQKGFAQLTLLSNLGYTLDQRFATIAPSSQVNATGSTTTAVRIKDSYGVAAGGEADKWTRFVGLPIVVHDQLWTRSDSAIFAGFDRVDPYKLLLASPLGFTPQPNDIVDIAPYGSGTDPKVNALYKTLFTFVDPTLTVVTGISNTQFTVSSGDAAKILVGASLFIHNSDYSIESNQVKVQSVIGTTVTVAASLGFTPSAGQLVENVGWTDGGGSYLIL